MRPIRPRNEQGGNLVVVGHDKITIPLKDFPHRIEVHFKRKNAPPPCDPHHHHHHHDELEWEVRRHYHSHHHQFTLKIKWKVHDVREIFWIAYF